MKVHQPASRRYRSQRGSILIIGIFLLAVLIPLLLYLGVNFHHFLRERSTAQTAAEAAALTAASDISRIITRDPKWGFVALSDQPPAGKATLAGDGEPLPVIGVNTILASARLEKLLADELGNDELDGIAQQDIATSKAACDRLQQAMDAAVSPTSSSLFNDMNGNKVTPFTDAKQQFLGNLPGYDSTKCRVENFKVSLGWLDEGSTTCSLDPQRDGTKNKYYPAFVNVPAAKNDFYFAGFGEQPRLADPSRFRPRDGKRFCSAVMVECKLAYYSDDNRKLYDVESRAVALPYGGKNRSAAGSLVVFLPQGGLNQFRSIRDLLNSGALKKHSASVTRSQGGDFPSEPQARLVCDEGEPKATLSSCVGRALFDWVRNTRARVRLSSAVAMINAPFNSSSTNIGPGAVVLYDFDRKGACTPKLYRDGGFLTQTVADGQRYINETRITETEKGMLGITIRDQVADIGTNHKHGGQPMAGELPVDYSTQSVEPESPGGEPQQLLRKSALKGGLAVCIQLFVTP